MSDEMIKLKVRTLLKKLVFLVVVQLSPTIVSTHPSLIDFFFLKNVKKCRKVPAPAE